MGKRGHTNCNKLSEERKNWLHNLGREFSNAITNRINNCLQQQARGRSVVWRQDNLFDFGGFPTYPKWKGTRGTEKIHGQYIHIHSHDL
ncbi:hypothetical protein GOP47_0008691 [Adiantum capillus-veneris]|uniref:Uncharacterized protein n=1 Tax=Adiantum capillus-veneris TaxID=13818 RepID=A0A9D4UZB9_ADICA|nr:hypothetical protein GOP47_0008691 [Adiantum capillus-veneris]